VLFARRWDQVSVRRHHRLDRRAVIILLIYAMADRRAIR
jgi:hypothetical protein